MRTVHFEYEEVRSGPRPNGVPSFQAHESLNMSVSKSAIEVTEIREIVFCLSTCTGFALVENRSSSGLVLFYSAP